MVAQLIRGFERLAQPQPVGGHRQRRLRVILAGHTMIGNDDRGVLIALTQQHIHVHHPLLGSKNRVSDVRISRSQSFKGTHGALPLIAF